jgi:hypothetical protein
MSNNDAPIPRWKRKRWIALAILLLIAWYPLSAGPAAYFDGRGWVPGDIAKAPYLPLAMGRNIPAVELWMDYANWFYLLGQRHAGARFRL